MFALPLLVLCSSYFFPPYLDAISIRFQYFPHSICIYFVSVLYSIFIYFISCKIAMNIQCGMSFMNVFVSFAQTISVCESVPVGLYAANVISVQHKMSSSSVGSKVTTNRKLIWKYQPCFYFPLFRLRAASFSRSFDWRSCYYLGSFHFITTKIAIYFISLSLRLVYYIVKISSPRMYQITVTG